MRHSRAQHQLERTGSILDRGSFGLAMSTMGGSGSPKSPIVGLPESRNTISSPPSRGDSSDSLNLGFLQQLQKQQKAEGTSSPNKMDPEEFMRQSAKLKPVLLQAIEEVMGELETTHEDVAKGAREHIHSS
jgi:translation initiation factor eIF-2B subunit beta